MRSLKLNGNRHEYHVRIETFKTLQAFWADQESCLQWPHPFVIPTWMENWWQVFADNHELNICSFWHNNHLIGIAPLMNQGQKSGLIGNKEIFDYSDFITCPCYEQAFFRALIQYLKNQGIGRLQLYGLRPDSAAFTKLIPMSKDAGFKTHIEQEDVTVELPLPGSWDEFLYLLNSKQRHEIRRKLRRLNEAGDIRFHVVRTTDDLEASIDTFLHLFVSNRPDKADFMTGNMPVYFRGLIKSMAKINLLKLCFLEIDQTRVASVMCFDYRKRRYLYNSGYDSAYGGLAVGLLSKIMSIKDGIENDCHIYDFLRGGEVYKFRMGGKPIPIYQCLVEL